MYLSIEAYDAVDVHLHDLQWPGQNGIGDSLSAGQIGYALLKHQIAIVAIGYSKL